MADLLVPHSTDADVARAHLEAKRWPEGPVCPHCGVIDEATKLEMKEGAKTHARKGAYQCNGCREQFTVTVGTIFEDSHVPLNKWLLAIHLLCASKKGMSAHQLHRMIGVTYKTAWFMAHRIRYAMTQEPLSSKLGGTVEVDETYVGGKEKGIGGGAGNRDSKKVPVISMVERNLVRNEKTGKNTNKGRVRSTPVARVTLDNLKPILKEHIETGTRLNTDEATVYYFIKDEFPNHDRIQHKQKEYTRFEDGRMVTTNMVEGYFSILKRGIHGVYHHVGRQHLHRYLSEFDFRYNARDISDRERATLAVKGIGGKRLTYRYSFKRVS
jgi:transposase-like protein